MKGLFFSSKTLAWSILLAATTFNASAVVTPLGYYKLGENDPGATPGQPGQALSLSSGGGPPVQSFLSTTYSGDVGTSLSTISMNLAGGYYQFAAPLTSAVNNFGIEGWFKASATTGNRVLAYNGDTGDSGFGLFLVGAQIYGVYGGNAILNTGQSIVPNTWTYVALVRDGGVSKLFVNNTTPIIRSGAPNPASGTFSIGANSAGNEQFGGLADEVRVFTFSPGQFNPNTDLLIVPEPGTLALAGLGVAGLFWLRRRK